VAKFLAESVVVGTVGVVVLAGEAGPHPAKAMSTAITGARAAIIRFPGRRPRRVIVCLRT
ncbi:MAG: hypothetical protein M1565_00935, partial [Actinobacteria bacterium]|nr:hypothetical protein [Actinomycetota bacterium]